MAFHLLHIGFSTSILNHQNVDQSMPTHSQKKSSPKAKANLAMQAISAGVRIELPHLRQRFPGLAKNKERLAKTVAEQLTLRFFAAEPFDTEHAFSFSAGADLATLSCRWRFFPDGSMWFATLPNETLGLLTRAIQSAEGGGLPSWIPSEMFGSVPSGSRAAKILAKFCKTQTIAMGLIEQEGHWSEARQLFEIFSSEPAEAMIANLREKQACSISAAHTFPV